MDLALPLVATGHVLDGRVVLENPLAAPNGTVVRVEVINAPTAEGNREPSGVTLRERLKNFLSHPPLDLPPDASQNIDRYLYGDGES